MALHLPRALSQHRVGGRDTLCLGGQSLPEQRSGMEKDAGVINAAEGIVLRYKACRQGTGSSQREPLKTAGSRVVA